MDGFATKIGTLVTLILLVVGGCIGPPVGGDGATGTEQALVEAEDTTCMQAALRQYLECRELDCAQLGVATWPTEWLPAIVVQGYDQLCERDCQTEAAIVHAECEGVAGAFGQPLPTQATLRQWHEPDYRIIEHAGPTGEECIHCAQPPQ